MMNVKLSKSACKQAQMGASLDFARVVFFIILVRRSVVHMHPSSLYLSGSRGSFYRVKNTSMHIIFKGRYT